MQLELDGAAPAVGIQLLGVNLIGAEAGNASVTAGVDLPWLQDVESVDAWTAWGAEERDVFVLDGENRLLTIYNLTTHDLAVPDYYDELRQILLDAAAAEGG